MDQCLKCVDGISVNPGVFACRPGVPEISCLHSQGIGVHHCITKIYDITIEIRVNTCMMACFQSRC